MKKVIAFALIMQILPFVIYAQWTTSGTNIYNTNTGTVGVGTSSPSTSYKMDISGRLNISDEVHARKNLLIWNAAARPWLMMKNDVGETATPTDGALLMGSAYGGAIRLGNNFSNSGITYRYLQLGRVDNNYAFTPALTIGSESLNVGIGATNPATNLEINGTSSSTDVTWPLMVRNSANDAVTGYGTGIKLKMSSDNANEANKWAGVAAIANSTYSNQTDLAFFTNVTPANLPTEKVRITSNGKVGIGTSSPSSMLEVNSGAANAASGLVLNQGTSGGNLNSSRLFFSNEGDITTNSFSIFKNSNNLAFSYGANPGSLSGTQAMVLRNDGNLGIGITSPQTKLHVNGTQLITQGYFALTTTGNSTATGGAAGFSIVTTAPNSFNNGYSDLQSFYAGVGYIAPMVLQRQGGNVWVGDPTALNNFNDNYKLNVNGNIRANKLVVNTTGADFVFEPNYKLITLNQLEKYVTANHHLPGIETANAMQKDGVDVGDNQTKLLQKIEELTLYIIDQNKKLNNQSDQLKQMQQQIDELKASKK